MTHAPADHVAVRSRDFTLDRALLVLHCRDAYDRETVARAALWMLGSMDADDDDIRLAAALLAG